MSLYEKKFLEYKGELPIALQTNFFLEQESCISLYQEEKNGKEPLQHTPTHQNTIFMTPKTHTYP